MEDIKTFVIKLYLFTAGTSIRSSFLIIRLQRATSHKKTKFERHVDEYGVKNYYATGLFQHQIKAGDPYVLITKVKYKGTKPYPSTYNDCVFV